MHKLARFMVVPMVVGAVAFLYAWTPANAESKSAPAKDQYTDSAATKKAFEDIYKNATWGAGSNGTTKGTSGTGSTVKSTLLYRIYLQQFLADNNIKSVVDAGCGDWEFSQTINWKGIDYKGYDIVDALVAANTKKFGAPNIHFFAGDITELDLPAADLLISKHVMQHIPTTAALKFLKQIKKYKHVILTNGVDPQTLTAENTDISVGGYRPLDVTKPPFSLNGTKALTYFDGEFMHQVVHIKN